MTDHLEICGVEIPLRSAAEIAADIEKSPFKDDEKVADTPVSSVDFCGVAISSRYSKARELRTMIAMVRALDTADRERVANVFCDSKACACYTVTFKMETSGDNAYLALMVMEGACLIFDGGHNGIFSNVAGADRNPNWEEGPNALEIHLMSTVPAAMGRDWNDVLASGRAP